MSARFCTEHMKEGAVRVAPAWCHECKAKRAARRNENRALVKVPPLKQTPGKPAKTPKPIEHHAPKEPKAKKPTEHGKTPKQTGRAQTHGTPTKEPSAGRAPSNGDGGFNRNPAGEFAPKVAYRFGLHPLRTKALVETSPEGIPILRLLASGTKLDSQSYLADGVEVLGEKVTPALLMTMQADAKAGSVYLLENHHATLPMGESVNASIENLPDGNQELYVDFALDMANPDTRFLVSKLEADPSYEPQCSVGVFVRREIDWDPSEAGYVGFLVEGRFEHVALTRPNHAAYPDADVEELFMADSMEAAMKAAGIVPRSSKSPINAAGNGGKGAIPVTTKNVAGGVALRTPAEAEAELGKSNPETEPDHQAHIARLKEGGGDGEAEMESEAEAEARKKKEAEAEAEAGHKEDEDKKEGEAKKDDEAAAPGAAAPGEPPAAPPAMGLKEDDLMKCREMAGGLSEMMKDALDGGVENVDPQDLADLVTDIHEDIEQLCTMLGVEGYGPGEMEAEAEAEGEAEAEDAAPPVPPAPPEKKPAPAPPAAPKKPAPPAEGGEPPAEGGDTHVHAQPGSTVQIGKSTRAERNLKRLIQKQGRLIAALTEKVKKIDSTPDPNQAMPLRFNDGQGLEQALKSSGAAAGGSIEEELKEMLKGIKDPAERERVSKEFASRLLAHRFEGR